MIYAYYRVSTDKQDYEAQKVGVADYAKRNGLTIDAEVLDYGVSGCVVAKKRKLGRLLRKIKPGDIIITSELSRLGRSTVDVINTCNYIVKHDVKCYMVKQGMAIDQSPVGKLMIAIFSAFAEMERDLISMRTKEGLVKARERGSVIGRPVGRKSSYLKLDKRNIKRLNADLQSMSQRKVAKKYRVATNTLAKYIRERGIEIKKSEKQP